MSTGISKGVLLGTLLLGLAACEDFAGLNLAGTGQSFALSGANLAGGTVKLMPPPGFCVDRRSVRDSFALMARCDTLGGQQTTDAPLAIITATTVAVTGAAQISTSNFDSAAETVLQRADDGPLALVQVTGAPPSTDMRSTYWRGAAQVGNHVLGLAIYEDANSTALDRAGQGLLTQTVERTQEQSVVAAVAPPDNSATPAPKQSGNGVLAGLFE
ncbi:hypothetical protein [Tateyamaria omphalii]|uniref:Uncharacterized protein n=1 Tax=Tateyamaria omphalii TaxID=299262 RepID=A0A1P8MZ70_9RHOB|nr:hypothetical protein [Tateyamaria omphalii]APX13199.1 hypothetical protein BWR18_17045 [Tateyamaria omphalii]